MPAPEHTTFYHDVYNIVSQIPSGHVMTYGQIATLMGWPRHSRMVGRALCEVPAEMELPCHRVVNCKGRTAPQWKEQKALLCAEGIEFKDSCTVMLDAYQWKPEEII